MTFKCIDCKQILDDDVKVKRPNTYICKNCSNIRQKQWRDKNPEKVKRIAENSKERQRDWWLKRNYGISLEYYNKMFEFQDGKCAICATEHPGGKNNKFQVDHCHETGKVRGLLCDRCNRGIGFFSDDYNTMRAAAYYLDFGSTFNKLTHDD